MGGCRSATQGDHHDQAGGEHGPGATDRDVPARQCFHGLPTASYGRSTSSLVAPIASCPPSMARSNGPRRWAGGRPPQR